MSTEEKNKRVQDTARIGDLFRHAADIVVELSLDGRIQFISDAVEKILSRSTSHFVGRSFLEVIIPEDREHTLSVFQKVVTTGIEPLVRFRVLRSDALRVEFEASIRIFQRDDARCIVVVARDITQQSAEIAVTRKRDDYYRTLVESGSRPYAIVDHKGEVLFSNRNFKAAFAHAENSNDIFIRTPDAMRHAIETAWYESSRSDGAQSGGVDFNYIHDDGSTSWYAVSWNAFADEDGERLFTCVYEDITPRKQVEIALRSVAEGIAAEGAEGIERNIQLVAQALGFERFVVASISPEAPGFATIYAGVEHGRTLEQERIELHDLPDLTVSKGETCVFPSGVARLVPSVAEYLSPTYESYAGVPLRRGDGQVIGFVSGYSSAIAGDTELTRSLLTAFATQAAAFSDRRRANEEIRATEDRFRVLAAQAHEILVEVDQEGTVLYASAASDFILGYTPEDMLGKSIPRLVHPEDREKNRASQARLFSGEDEHSFVVNRVLHADGHWRWLESRTSSFTAPDGSPRALILSRDITDQRHQELGRELLYRVVQSGADLVFVCETDTRLVFANEPAMRRLSAHSQGIRRNNDGTPEEMAPLNAGIDATSIDANNVEGRRLDELLTEADSERLQNEILHQLTPTTPWSGELQLRSPDDNRPIETEATIFVFVGQPEDDGRTYLAVTLRDIDARRRVEEALHESEIRLNQAQKMEAVGRLAGGIAHDFNNLLTAIIGYSDLVIDELDEGHVARRDAQEILRAAERAGGLTRQLLAFSRRQVMQAEQVDLNAVVADIDRMMRRLIGENIELVTLQDGELHPIIADPGQIEQVIVNLVVNARDAMPHGGRLMLETENVQIDRPQRKISGELPAGAYSVLRVKDTGVGMDAVTLTQIFEPFFTTKEAHRGTGLGLATVYGIVSQSDGQIDVSSAPGEGTQFSIYFPIADTELEETLDTRTEAPLGGDETILLVEDSAPVRRLVQRTLEKAGYSVLSAESSTAALRHCSRHDGPIDLLLADVVLPRTPGPEVARRAEELRPGLPVVFMSGFTDDTLVGHGLDLKRANLLEKPFTPTTVLSRVRAALDEKTGRGEARRSLARAVPTGRHKQAFPVEQSD